MSDLDDDELKETKKFYSEKYYNKEKEIIKEFKKRIEKNYEDIINMEVIEIYCLQYDLTEDEKNILIRRFL